MLKYIIPFSITALLALCSCQKCAECALIANNGTSSDTTYNEYCGNVLDDIEATPNYTKNGVTYKWSCE
jgi:hypothetical protein